VQLICSHLTRGYNGVLVSVKTQQVATSCCVLTETNTPL